MLASGEKVTARKVEKECDLNHSSLRTIRRSLRGLKYKYKTAVKKIILTKKHKAKRVEVAKAWIAKSHPWIKVIFTDEKRFNLDGPDSWRSWEREDRPLERNKRQQGGGNVQVWGMVLPNNSIRVFQLSNRSKSADYINFLESGPLPIIYEHLGTDFIFMQDNASTHTSKESLQWFEDWGISLMD